MTLISLGVAMDNTLEPHYRTEIINSRRPVFAFIKIEDKMVFRRAIKLISFLLPKCSYKHLSMRTTYQHSKW